MGSDQSHHAPGSMTTGDMSSFSASLRGVSGEGAQILSPRQESVCSDSEVPYVSYTVNKPIGDSPKKGKSSKYRFASPRLSKKSVSTTDALVREDSTQTRNSRRFGTKDSTLVVVNRPDCDSSLQDDPELTRLREIPAFLPIMRASLSSGGSGSIVKDPDILERLDNRGLMAICQRYENHLRISASVVSTQQMSDDQLNDVRPLQFVSFSSSIHPGFWTSISKMKLEVSKLDQSPIDIHGSYVNNGAKDLPASLHVEWDACDMATQVGSLCWNTFPAQGVVINFNTLEAFKSFDKTRYLDTVEGSQLWEAIQSGEAAKRPDLLNRFVILMYADLKKYHYYYWFAFPALSLPLDMAMSGSPQKLSEVYSDETCQALAIAYLSWKKENQLSSGFFSLTLHNLVSVDHLEVGLNEEDGSRLIGFADPCTSDQFPGWPLRNLLVLVASKFGRRKLASTKSPLTVVCLRQKSFPGGKICIGHSIIVQIRLNGDAALIDEPIFKEQPKCVGFEKNESGQFAPRFANMKASMDPKSLAESSVDLNLKLMKWRLVPEMDLNQMANTKCLLLGSGTLGCNVARCLLGWGIKYITFVDNSKVSFSNPVRQSLYNFADCLEGGQPKAEAAARSLTSIFPGVKTVGINLNIPLPAHPVSEGLMEETKKNFELLDGLIQRHDVIFLLMDTRESRWLPTVMASHYGKLVINAALGFDSYLVMRHGVRTGAQLPGTDANLIPGNQLGCHFCTDVVAPGNSTRDRTLDQQCTVTRPGVSYMAAALAVELMASTVQHPNGSLAPSSIGAKSKAEEGLLGIVPHTIRGSIHSFEQFLPTTPLFSHCTACSSNVLSAFALDKFGLFIKAANSAKFLEDLAGLSNLLSDDIIDDVIECSDSDDF